MDAEKRRLLQLVAQTSFRHEKEAVFRLASGKRRIMVKQIAGLIARRILPWAATGDALKGGQLIGLIQFGSQVDLGLTKDAEILVQVGDKVVGGETVLARYGAKRGRGKR